MADHPINDYYVITSLRVGQPERWGWEIHRRSKPLGIKMTGDGYQSETAAQFAGKRALADFLTELLKEENASKAALSWRLVSFPQTNGNGARNDQDRYQHPVLDLQAKDVESLHKHMHGRFLRSRGR